MPRARKSASALLGVEQDVHERGVAAGLELAEQLAEALHDLRRGCAVHGVRPETAPELPHHRGGLEAATRHVADCQAEPAARERERVVPVAAELGPGRRQVAPLQAHSENLGQPREEALLERVGQAAIAFRQAPVDCQRGAVARAREQVHVVVREIALLERAHVKHPDHLALHDQRHAEQRPEALLAQQWVHDLRMLDVRDAHRLAGARHPSGEALPHTDAHTPLHLLLEALGRARYERPAIVLEQQDRRRAGIEHLHHPHEQLVEQRLERRYESAESVTLSVAEPVVRATVAMRAILHDWNNRRVSSASHLHAPNLTTVMRSEDRVTPLELFFDLVFVLVLTQCTALMAADPTWEGLAQGLLVLGVMWWSWVGYAWLTSVVDPEEGIVRFAIFGAMAALLVVALCVPQAFGDLGLLFACAYAIVRVAQIVLFVVASRDDPGLRHSVIRPAVSTAIGSGLSVAASFADGGLQGALWVLALTLDMGGPLFIDSSGWRLAPAHFAERHGLIVIIALGESIVAIGVGAHGEVDAGVVVAAVLGVAVAGALWWLYFDIVALVAERRLSNAAEGRERNEVARDSFSYLHLPMVAGIVLLALGLKKRWSRELDDPLKLVPAVAMLGGIALYLLAHVAFRWRNVHRFSVQRLVCAVVLVAFIPAAEELPALVTLGLALALLVAVITYETVHFAELRERLRHQLAAESAPD